MLRVDGYSERWLRRGFPWVYPKEVTGGPKVPVGTEIGVVGPSGEVLGRALTESGFLAARVYRHEDAPLDTAWLESRLDAAARLRDEVLDKGTSGYRLVSGENDGIPGVRVDWWSHCAVIALDGPGAAPLVPGVVAWLSARRSPRSVHLCWRPDPRDPRDPAGFLPQAGLVDGHAPTDDVRVTERGVAFLVRPSDGPDVGLYPDLREVRAWLEPHWGGKSVLNTFAFTGAFSVCAARGGASEVVSVDLSEKSLDRAQANFRANDLDPDAYEFLAEDVFRAFDRFRRTGRRFDRVVLDPPAFSRSPEGTWSAAKDYGRLVSAAARVLAPDGWILAVSNQGELGPREFRGLVTDGLWHAGFRGQELFWGGQGADVPAATWFPEGRYLKAAAFRVVR